MYCRECFTDLRGVTDVKCPQCGKSFDPAKPRTYFAQPFPSKGAIVLQVVATTVVAVVFAFVIAFFQLTRSSGH